MNDIKLSIIIPAYNIENTIERTLLSIVPQLSSNVELIIVNDGSTDLTRNKVDGIIGNYSDKRIIVINTKNEGVLFARLNGLKISSGEYIWFIDGGDTITKESILIITNALKSSSDIYHLDSITLPTNNIISYKYNNVTCSDLLLGKVAFSIWARVFKRKLLEEDAFDITTNIILGEDMCLSYLITEKAKKIENINKVIYEYYLDENSVSHNKMNDVAILDALNFLRNRASEIGLIKEFEYFAFSQIIVRYLMFKNNRKVYELLISYYKKLEIKNNPYIKMRRISEIYVFIKSRNNTFDSILTNLAKFLAGKIYEQERKKNKILFKV